MWFLLPLSVGFALRDALSSWSSAPATLAAILLYAAWLAGLVALVALHPWSFTVLRVVAPASVIASVLGVGAASPGLAALAVVHALAACACCLHGSLARECAQGAAYGDEVRLPLRTPPMLCLVLGIVVPLIAAGVATGPLLLADGRVAWGIGAAIVGLPLAVALARSVHSLSRRFVVFVPAGFVLSDPLTMPDPVLLPREHVTGIRLAPPIGRVDGIDMRLGAAAGAIVVTLDEPGSFTVRQGRGRLELREAASVWCTPQRPSSVLAVAAQRHVGAITRPG